MPSGLAGHGGWVGGGETSLWFQMPLICHSTARDNNILAHNRGLTYANSKTPTSISGKYSPRRQFICKHFLDKANKLFLQPI